MAKTTRRMGRWWNETENAMRQLKLMSATCLNALRRLSRGFNHREQWLGLAMMVGVLGVGSLIVSQAHDRPLSAPRKSTGLVGNATSAKAVQSGPTPVS